MYDVWKWAALDTAFTHAATGIAKVEGDALNAAGGLKDKADCASVPLPAGSVCGAYAAAKKSYDDNAEDAATKKTANDTTLAAYQAA